MATTQISCGHFIPNSDHKKRSGQRSKLDTHVTEDLPEVTELDFSFALMLILLEVAEEATLD